MKNILILYATREGQTEKVALRITVHLRALGAKVAVIDARDITANRDFELDTFDLLVFGASMHAGGIEKELADFINRRKEQIERKTRSIFLVLLSAASKHQDLRAEWLADARKKMDGQLVVTFDDIEMIAGALMYSKYSKPMKWVMKRIAEKAGEDTDTSQDYEYTDWEQVERYADRLNDR